MHGIPWKLSGTPPTPREYDGGVLRDRWTVEDYSIDLFAGTESLGDGKPWKTTVPSLGWGFTATKSGGPGKVTIAGFGWRLRILHSPHTANARPVTPSATTAPVSRSAS